MWLAGSAFGLQGCIESLSHWTEHLLCTRLQSRHCHSGACDKWWGSWSTRNVESTGWDSSKHFSNSIVQSLSCVRLFVTQWTAALQASLSFTISWSLHKLMSIESVMPSNHLILCWPQVWCWRRWCWRWLGRVVCTENGWGYSLNKMGEGLTSSRTFWVETRRMERTNPRAVQIMRVAEATAGERPWGCWIFTTCGWRHGRKGRSVAGKVFVAEESLTSKTLY